MPQPLSTNISPNNTSEKPVSITKDDIEAQAAHTAHSIADKSPIVSDGLGLRPGVSLSTVKPVSKKPHATASWTTIYLAFQALGVIFGDLATSPLYSFSTIFPRPPEPGDVVGATSCILWSFFLVCIVKYGIFVFRYGLNGEQGGTVAIYAKLARHLNLDRAAVLAGIPGSGDDTGNDMEALSRNMISSAAMWMGAGQGPKNNYAASYWSQKTLFSILASLRNRFLKIVPIFLCFFGSCLTISDGLLTPTTSVLSAIEGIAVASPNVESRIVVISCIILALLYLFQRAGISRLATVFAPIISIWLICLLVIGIINITHYPHIFKAFSPHFAIRYLRKHHIDGLSGVMLALTGAECMFADIGHFTVASVDLALMVVVFPVMMISYLGQAARLHLDPSVHTNVFYLTIPGPVGGGFYWFMFVIATLATVIASQSVILSAFSLYMQLDHLDAVPKFKINHVSKKIYGRVYVPFLNYVIMIAVILTTVGFQKSSHVTNAYGLCVALVFACTTALLWLTMTLASGVPGFLALLFFLGFGALDMCFVAAEIRKFPRGAWFPLTLSLALTILMYFWKWCRSLKQVHEYSNRVHLSNLFRNLSRVDELELRKSRTMSSSQDPPVVVVPPPARRSSSAVCDEEEDKFLSPPSTTAVNFGTISEAKEASTRRRSIKFSENPASNRDTVVKLPGLAIFYSDSYFTLNSANTVPPLFSNYLKSMNAMHERVVFLAVRYTGDDRLQDCDRMHVEPIPQVRGLYRAIVRYGFNERPRLGSQFIRVLTSKIRAADKSPGEAVEERDSVEEVPSIATVSSTSGVCVEEDLAKFVPIYPVVHFFGFEKAVANVDDEYDTYWQHFKGWLRTFLIDQVFSPLDSAVGGSNLRYEVESDNVFTLETLARI